MGFNRQFETREEVVDGKPFTYQRVVERTKAATATAVELTQPDGTTTDQAAEVAAEAVPTGPPDVPRGTLRVILPSLYGESRH